MSNYAEMLVTDAARRVSEDWERELDREAGYHRDFTYLVDPFERVARYGTISGTVLS